MKWIADIMAKLHGHHDRHSRDYCEPPAQASEPPVVPAHKPRHEKATKRGAQRGAFGSGCKGPFDPRPALKPSEMRALEMLKLRRMAK